MRRASSGVMAAAIALSACTVSKAEDGGPTTSRTFPVGGFTKIEVAGPFDVDVTTGGQPNVAAQGPQKLLDRMVVEVDGSTLRIHPEKRTGWFRSGSRWSGGKARVAVSAPMIEAASIAGSGDVRVNRVSGPRFAGSIAGSGNLRIGEVRVEDLRLEIAGSGEASAAGQAARARYEIAGSGDIRAGQVASAEISADIAGSGNIEANARDTAKVGIAGSGDVRVTGGAKCSISKAGSGNVECS